MRHTWAITSLPRVFIIRLCMRFAQNQAFMIFVMTSIDWRHHRKHENSCCSSWWSRRVGCLRTDRMGYDVIWLWRHTIVTSLDCDVVRLWHHMIVTSYVCDVIWLWRPRWRRRRRAPSGCCRRCQRSTKRCRRVRIRPICRIVGACPSWLWSSGGRCRAGGRRPGSPAMSLVGCRRRREGRRIATHRGDCRFHPEKCIDSTHCRST